MAYPYKVLVFGGRDYSNVNAVNDALGLFWKAHGGFCLIEGGARGADRLARGWADRNGMPRITMDANWPVYNKGAGSIRNQWMLDYAQPNYAIGFPGGAGTADMTQRVLDRGIALWLPQA